MLPASLSWIVYCLCAIPGAYPRLGHLKGASLGKAPVFAASTRPRVTPRVEHLKGHNKLECLLLASLSSIVICLWASPGAYPGLGLLKGVSLGEASALPARPGAYPRVEHLKGLSLG